MQTSMPRRMPLVATAIVLVLAGCASTPATTRPAVPKAASTVKQVPAVSTAQWAVANLASASGSLVSGRLMLVPMGDGVHITGEVGGFSPGSSHGFHVHEKGDCSAADGASAGGHFNPGAQPHGRAMQGTHHAGDSDNIVADAKGVARVDAHLMGVTLGGGASNDIAGRAVVVHAIADDYTSQPSGNAGARVACAVIKVVR